MPTKEELEAKSDATRLKNLLAKKAAKKPLTKWEQGILKHLKGKAKKGQTPATANWLSEPASPEWKGRKIRNEGTKKEYVIGDVFGELHVELEREAQTTIRTAASLRGNYKPI